MVREAIVQLGEPCEATLDAALAGYVLPLACGFADVCCIHITERGSGSDRSPVKDDGLVVGCCFFSSATECLHLFPLAVVGVLV